MIEPEVDWQTVDQSQEMKVDGQSYVRVGSQN